MIPERNQLVSLQESLERLHQGLSRLNDRVTALERSLGAIAAEPRAAPSAPVKGGPKNSPPESPHPADTPLDEELVVVLSAAVAAYLGVKPHIRQIRLIGSAAWVQHGRATIQASHAIAVHHS